MQKTEENLATGQLARVCHSMKQKSKFDQDQSQ